MAHENKNNEATGNKASEIKKNVVELNENDLSKVAGGAPGSASRDAGLKDDVVTADGLLDPPRGPQMDPPMDTTFDDGTVVEIS